MFSSQNPTQAAAASGGQGKVIYDALMGLIEPELLSNRVAEIAAQNADETPEQHEERMQRYAQAFEIFEEAYGRYKQGIDEAVHACARSSREAAEARVLEEDMRAQEELLTAIDE